MKRLKALKQIVTGFLTCSLVSLCILPATALASQTGANAWESILTKITDSLTGPVAYSISIIAIFICGLIMAFTDLQGGAKRFVQAAIGISIMVFAAQILTGFLGFSGAVI